MNSIPLKKKKTEKKPFLLGSVQKRVPLSRTRKLFCFKGPYFLHKHILLTEEVSGVAWQAEGQKSRGSWPQPPWTDGLWDKSK